MTTRQRPLPRRGIFALAAIVSSIWMTASPTATTMALIVRDDTSSVEGVLSPASNVCTSITSSYMACNPDPLVLYQKVGYATAPPKGQIDLGVKQRIDGNDAEIEGIKKVIKLMNQYFVEEVLSMYEYGLIVPKWYAVCERENVPHIRIGSSVAICFVSSSSSFPCSKNHNELCAFW